MRAWGKTTLPLASRLVLSLLSAVPENSSDENMSSVRLFEKQNKKDYSIAKILFLKYYIVNVIILAKAYELNLMLKIVDTYSII